MKYFIDKVNTWGPANRKCAELHQEMKQYENCLVADEVSRDALVEQVRHTVETLNKAYPRTRQLMVDAWNNHVSCHPNPRSSDSDAVFSFTLAPVKREFCFAERVERLLPEGGDQ